MQRAYTRVPQSVTVPDAGANYGGGLLPSYPPGQANGPYPRNTQLVLCSYPVASSTNVDDNPVGAPSI